MSEQIPPMIEIIPAIKGKGCRLGMYLVYGVLAFGPMCLGVGIGWCYHPWLGVAVFLFLTLVSGIVTAKMRVLSIPPLQREMDYSTMAIVRWYLAKHHCF